MAPLHIRLRGEHRIAVREVRLHRDLGAHLLAGGDQQRRVIGLRIQDPADRVAHAGGRVQVDVRDISAGLRETVGHPDDDELLQAEDVAEVIGEPREHRQLGRAWVAEDRRDPASAEQLEGRVAHVGKAADSRPAFAHAPAGGAIGAPLGFLGAD